MSSEYIENHTYDEIEPGQSAELTKTLTADEVALFGRVSGDLNPTHIAPADTHADLSTLTAHSIWNTSLVSGLLGNSLPGPGTVHLREEAEFLAPVHIGETVVASVRVEEKKANNIVSLSFLVALSCGTPAAGIVLGAKVPIILTSRADSVRSRRASAAIAMLYAHKTQSQSKAGGIQ